LTQPVSCGTASTDSNYGRPRFPYSAHQGGRRNAESLPKFSRVEDSPTQLAQYSIHNEMILQLDHFTDQP
jgi:hypothetical protein